MHEILDQCAAIKPTHVYLNSNHTKLEDGFHKVVELLTRGYRVSYEYGDQGGLNPEPIEVSHPMLVHLRSVVVKNVKNHPGHYLKIDDEGFDNTNPGVWTVSVARLGGFTPWSAYLQDSIIE